MIALEMMREITHTQLALDAVYKTGLPVWAGYSCTVIDGEPWLWSGNDRLVDGLAAIADQPIELVAIMHTEVNDIDVCLDVLHKNWDGPVGVYAHMGRLDGVSWIFDNTVSPEEYAVRCKRWVEGGVNVVGGCCGIGPDHVALLQPLATR